MRRGTRRPLAWAVLAAGAALMFAAAECRGQATGADFFWTVHNTQTLAGTTPDDGAWFDPRLFYTSPGDYGSATMTSPSTLLMSDFPAFTVFDSGNQNFADQAAMDAAYPFGTYTITATAGTQPAVTVSADYTASAYPQTTAELTTGTFAALQGMDASQPFTFNLVPFTPAGNATVGLIYLTIYDSSSNVVFSDPALPSNTTSILLPANTLTAGQSYTFDLNYSDRIYGTDPNSGVDTALGFDNRTDGTFQAVPEPSTAALLGLGALGLVAARRPGRGRALASEGGGR